MLKCREALDGAHMDGDTALTGPVVLTFYEATSSGNETVRADGIAPDPAVPEIRNRG